ncbi:hypothetical protein GCM10027046_13310 [Uliginosibacterium flavum]
MVAYPDFVFNREVKIMRYKFFINSIPIHVRSLPSGDLAVWHPFNAEIQAVVEPICRGCGYWNPAFKNWVVRAACKHRVLAALSHVGRLI